MYNDHDRPSTKRIVITIASIAAGIALLAVGVWALMGIAAPKYAADTASTQPAPVAQAPAKAKATVVEAQPAPVKPSTPVPVSKPVAATPKPKAAAPAPAPAAVSGVVVIDAGHEGSPPGGSEPVGPGSNTMKPKVESGTSGVATHVDESQRNLEVAKALQKSLEARGVKVVMVRTSQNVKIANSARAKIANANHAALFIRIHCDSGPSNVTGILTLRPSKNWYSGVDIVKPSKTAAQDVHSAVLAATGAKDRGITARGDLSGFNWAKVPSVLVEVGMMSNAGEDRKLATAAYQHKLAEGMANGIVKFIGR